MAGEECELQDRRSSSPRSVDLQSTSPWTYQDEGFNPALQPSNTAHRQATSVARKRPRSCIPESEDVLPYHHDYKDGDENKLYDEEDDDTSDESGNFGQVRLRRGSEGYEVRPVNRNDMLRRYLEEIGEKPGRYVRYIPQPNDIDRNEEESDNVPLAYAAGQSNDTV